MDSPLTYEALRDQADQAREAQEFELALKLYQEVLSLNAENAEALKNVGRGYQLLGNSSEAENYYRKAIETDPTCWIAFNNLGILSHDRQDLNTALEMYEKALALEPKQAMIYSNLGNLYVALKDFEKAQYYYDRALEIDPTNLAFLYNQAQGFLEEEDYQHSVLLFEKILEIIPDKVSGVVKLNLARGYTFLKEYQKAIRFWNLSIEHLEPYQRGSAYHNLAWIYQQLKQDDIAFEYCIKVSESNSKTSDEFDQLQSLYEAFSYFYAGSVIFQKGIQYLLEYALANPASDVAHYVLTLAFNKCGEYEKAETHAKRAIEINPAHPRSYYQLANAYLGQEEIELCLKTLKKMLEVDPLDYYEAHQAMAYIYREQGKYKQAKQMESRLESLKAYRLELKAAPEFLRDGEMRFSLFR